MRCCVKCFNNNHPYLIQFIKENGTRGGVCDYCGATKTPVIDPSELKPLFEPLISLYEPLSLGENVMPDEDWLYTGEPFATLLENDFSETALDRANELVEAIFTGNLSPFDLAEVPYRFSIGDLWCGRDRNFFSREAGTDFWDNFSYHLRYERRFIPDENDMEIYDPRYWLGEMVRQIEALLPAGTRFYRGRTELHSLDQMGAPPHELTSAGRANPKGISFLYLASDPATVVAELRPWKGQTISIAEFELVEQVKVVDLFQELPQLSPFGLPKDTNLYKLRDRYRVLQHLKRELSLPIDPRKADIDYLSTQYLTEIIRNEGYGGMIYQSAMGQGRNLVLFSPKNARAISGFSVKVTDISYRWIQHYGQLV